MATNKNIVLIMGEPATGKSASLINLDQPSMVYLNTDLKELPFKDNFMDSVEVSNSLDILSYVNEIEATPEVSGAVLDTITFLMDMHERQYVITAADTQKALTIY